MANLSSKIIFAYGVAGIGGRAREKKSRDKINKARGTGIEGVWYLGVPKKAIFVCCVN